MPGPAPIGYRELLAELERGQLHRFSEFAKLVDQIPASGAGIYAIWDEQDSPVYVGIAGRNPDGKGRSNRLRSHARGWRSGDQFRVYVADHYVLAELTRTQVEAIRDLQLSFDALVRERIHASFSFRFAPIAEYRAALALEASVKSGALAAGPPRLNPKRPSRAR